jgi:hypothetical protein
VIYSLILKFIYGYNIIVSRCDLYYRTQKMITFVCVAFGNQIHVILKNLQKSRMQYSEGYNSGLLR